MSRWLCFPSSGSEPEGKDGTGFYIKPINIDQFVNVLTRLHNKEIYTEHTLVDGWSQYATLVSMVIHSWGKELYLCSDSSFLTVSIFHCYNQHVSIAEITEGHKIHTIWFALTCSSMNLAINVRFLLKSTWVGDLSSSSLSRCSWPMSITQQNVSSNYSSRSPLTSFFNKASLPTELLHTVQFLFFLSIL